MELRAGIDRRSPDHRQENRDGRHASLRGISPLTGDQPALRRPLPAPSGCQSQRGFRLANGLVLHLGRAVCRVRAEDRERAADRLHTAGRCRRLGNRFWQPECGQQLYLRTDSAGRTADSCGRPDSGGRPVRHRGNHRCPQHPRQNRFQPGNHRPQQQVPGKQRHQLDPLGQNGPLRSQRRGGLRFADGERGRVVDQGGQIAGNGAGRSRTVRLVPRFRR